MEPTNQTSGHPRIRQNILWGVRGGGIFGFLYCLVAVAIYYLNGPEPFVRAGVTLTTTCIFYIGAGILSGCTVGLMRDWITSRFKSLVAGILAAIPVGVLCGVTIWGWPSQWDAGMALSVAICILTWGVGGAFVFWSPSMPEDVERVRPHRWRGKAHEHNMVNREARNAAKVAIQTFLSGQIDNDEFESAYPGNTGDLGVLAIEHVMWFFFSEHTVEKFSGPLLPDARALIDRIYLFLESDCSYDYEQYKFYSLSLGLKKRKSMLDPFAADSVWPFFFGRRILKPRSMDLLYAPVRWGFPTR